MLLSNICVRDGRLGQANSVEYILSINFGLFQIKLTKKKLTGLTLMNIN